MIDDGMRDGFAPNDEGGIDDMPDLRNDETLRDVVAALSTLPAASEADVQAIVARAAAEASETGRRSGHRWALAKPRRDARDAADVIPISRAPRRWYASVPLAAAAGLVLVAGIGGFIVRDLLSRPEPVTSVAATSERTAPAPAPLTGVPVSAVATGEEAPIPTQFVLDAPRAEEVSLVGAFNDWDPRSTPLVRDPATGLWSVTLPLAPGRHVYAFMVNGRTLTLDPRAPTTQDPELGTKGSVVLVGTP